MRLLPHRIYLLALEGRKTLHGRRLPTKKDAREKLCRLTGQDFEFDVDAWKEWIRNNRKGLYGNNPGPKRYTQWLAEKDESSGEGND